MGNTLIDISLNNIFRIVSSGKINQSKNKQMGLHQTKRLLNSKENYQQNEKTIYWMGEDICKRYIKEVVTIQTIQRTHTIQHSEKQIPYGLTYMWNLKKEEQSDKTLTHI